MSAASTAKKRAATSDIISLQAQSRSTQVAARLAAAMARPSAEITATAVPANTQISAAEVTAALSEAVQTPLAPPVAPQPSQARALAEMIAMGLGLHGHKVSVGDVLEQLTLHDSGSAPSLGQLQPTLKALGITANLRDISRAQAGDFPAFALNKQGALALLLGLGAGRGQVDLYDPDAPDQRREVALAQAGLAGEVLCIQTGIEQIAQRHTPQAAPKHWFWGQFARYRRQLMEVAAGSLVANILAVAVSLFSMQVYDRVIPYQSQPTLWVLAMGAMLAIVMEAALKLARSGLMDMTGKRIELAVQADLMEKLLGMKHGPAARSPSTLFSAMREFSSVREFFTATTIGTVADLPFILLFLALVASIGGNLVWILVAGGALMVLPGFLLQRKMVAMTHAAQGASTRAARLLYEAIFEAETVTTQRGEDRIRRIWSELSALSAVHSADQRQLTAKLGYWAQGVQQATYVLAVVAGAYMVFAGEFTVGTIIAVGMLTGRTLGPLAALSGTMAKWSNVKSALDGLDAIANAPQALDPARHYLRRDHIAGHFELRKTTFRYDPKGAATVDIDALAIPAGQHVAILGANGSGKSTLLRMLAGIYEPGEGRILLDGVDFGQVHPRDLRRAIGYLGQDVRLFAGSLRDNLNMTGFERNDERLLAALDFAGLGAFVRAHPRGLDLEIREMGEGLSVGQRQSLGWARLWLADPSVVILDEPTAALDQTLEAALVARLSEWLAGRTAIIATHRLPILQLAQRVMILQGGRAMVDGPRDAVLAHLNRSAAPAQGAPNPAAAVSTGAVTIGAVRLVPSASAQSDEVTE
ncbi:MAG: ATP-binding cassette domain-containing protein [Cypionkella sp.]|nr:ATP-binding cassette domain-containing protein [Cypionkella sp.]